MSRQPARMKVVDLQEGMPTVAQARLRMEQEIHLAQQEAYHAVKLVHGFGPREVVGDLRIELQKDLRAAAQNKTIRAFIPGEDWRVTDETSWPVLQQFREWKLDSDLGRFNLGISIVVF